MSVAKKKISPEDQAALLRVRLVRLVEEAGGVPSESPYENLEMVYDQLLRHLYLGLHDDDACSEYLTLTTAVGADEPLRVSFAVLTDRIAKLHTQAQKANVLTAEKAKLTERVATLSALNEEKNRHIEKIESEGKSFLRAPRGTITKWLAELDLDIVLPSFVDAELIAFFVLIHERCLVSPSTDPTLPTPEGWAVRRGQVRALLDARHKGHVGALLSRALEALVVFLDPGQRTP